MRRDVSLILLLINSHASNYQVCLFKGLSQVDFFFFIGFILEMNYNLQVDLSA